MRSAAGTRLLDGGLRLWVEGKYGPHPRVPVPLELTGAQLAGDGTTPLRDLLADAYVSALASLGVPEADARAHAAAPGALDQLLGGNVLVAVAGEVAVTRGRQLPRDRALTVLAVTEVVRRGAGGLVTAAEVLAVEDALNALREAHPAMPLRAALGAVATVVSPALGRTLLDLAAGHGLQAEGIDAAGRRVPASVLLDMTLEELGLAGLALRVFDPTKEDVLPEKERVSRERQETDVLHLRAFAGLYRGIYHEDFAKAKYSNINFALARYKGEVYLSKSANIHLHGCLDLPTRHEFRKFLTETGYKESDVLPFLYYTVNTLDRHKDSEVRILEHLRLDLLRDLESGDLDTSQPVVVPLASERAPCASCQFVMAQFVHYFAQRGVEVRFEVEWDRERFPDPLPWEDPPAQWVSSILDFFGIGPRVDPGLDAFFWREDTSGSFPVLYSPEWYASHP